MPSPVRRTSWVPWVLGIAVTAAVVSITLNAGRTADYASVLRQSNLAWLFAAALVQCGTYVAEAEVWRSMSCRANCPITFRRALALSFAKLFVDQSLPTGGVAGTMLATSALARHGVSKRTIAGTVILERATFLSAYALALVTALVVAMRGQPLNTAVVVVGFVFAAVEVGAAAGLVAASGHRRSPRWMMRLRPLKAFAGVLQRADPAVVRKPALFFRGLVLQGCVIALDTTTMVIVMRSLGSTVSITGVFASFMISSLFRTISIVPGGLGPFEASSVLTLRMVGAPMAVAASATLLFRVLSYWLPMVPGFWFARRAVTPRGRWSPAYS